jgi:putative hydrolases of HD superfamily
MDTNLKRAIDFTQLLFAFQRVERSVRVPGLARFENDAEHSYVLAVFAWYLIDTLRLPLDKGKVFEYALAHDLVEVYAGDTPAFGKGGNKGDMRSSKKEREALALKRLKSEFPEFSAFTRRMKEYDEQKDDEAKFVYALDKLVPIFSGYHNNGRDWNDNKISFEEILNYKIEQIKVNPSVYSLFQSVMALLESDKAKYFKP